MAAQGSSKTAGLPSVLRPEQWAGPSLVAGRNLETLSAQPCSSGGLNPALCALLEHSINTSGLESKTMFF